MTIAAYIRVSTGTQNLEAQQSAVEDWVVRQGVSPDAIKWYEDIETGRHIKRSGLRDLEADIVSGRITSVIVWKLDRLARSQREGIQIISRWCDYGVRLVSVTQQIDLSGSVGHMIAGVLFGIAEIELAYAKERQALGIALAKERGVYRGRKKGTFKASSTRAKELYRKGLTVEELSKSLGVSERTVYRYLK